MAAILSPTSPSLFDSDLSPDELLDRQDFQEIFHSDMTVDEVIQSWHHPSPTVADLGLLNLSTGSQQNTPISPNRENDQFTPISDTHDWLVDGQEGTAYTPTSSEDFDNISPLESRSSEWSSMSLHRRSGSDLATRGSRQSSAGPDAAQLDSQQSTTGISMGAMDHQSASTAAFAQPSFDNTHWMIGIYDDGLAGTTVNPAQAFLYDSSLHAHSWREAATGYIHPTLMNHEPSQHHAHSRSNLHQPVTNHSSFGGFVSTQFDLAMATPMYPQMMPQLPHSDIHRPSSVSLPSQRSHYPSKISQVHAIPLLSQPFAVNQSTDIPIRPLLGLQTQPLNMPPATQAPQYTSVPIPQVSHRQIFPADLSTVDAGRQYRASSEAQPSKGGRKKGVPLNEDKRQKSSKMRKRGACWRCAMQRDPCDGGDPCSRCLMRWQKGQQYFFDCDRSKLPDFIYDFLPPSMTLMHQKQNIEDCVHQQVRHWNHHRSIEVRLTSGYGIPLRWKLYEFEPATPELLCQSQYRQDATGRSIRMEKFSPALGITKLDTSDDTHFKNYLDQLMDPILLQDFAWTCFEEETKVNDFQATTLALITQLYARAQDYDLRDQVLKNIIRMLLITYIMGHTLTIEESTLPAVLSQLHQAPSHLTPHTSPRLANRQLKFFFSTLREKIYTDILKWQQATLHTSGHKESTWLSAFCVMLGLAMVLEEVQRTIQIQAETKAYKGEKTEAEAHMEARWACERIDERFKLLVGLFQCKYRDKKWTCEGSFGNGTPVLREREEREFLYELRVLVLEREQHLRNRSNVPLGSESQCQYTSRLVGKFLLPFLNLPVG